MGLLYYTLNTVHTRTLYSYTLEQTIYMNFLQIKEQHFATDAFGNYWSN